MSIDQNAVAKMLRSLTTRASIEVVPGSLSGALPHLQKLPPGSRVYIPSLPRGDFRDIVAACGRVAREGLRPVPHLAARTVPSRQHLEDRLGRLAAIGADELLLIAGDVRRPRGPFRDTLQVLESGLLQRHGFRRVGIAGHPEGHPAVDNAELRRSLALKAACARDSGVDMWLVTQFTFDARPVADWLRGLREDGIGLPVRVGIPGPAKIHTLLRFALQCGVGASSRVLRQRPEMVRKLAGQWTPDALLVELAQCCLADPAGSVEGIHLFPFGGVAQGIAWLGTQHPDAASRTDPLALPSWEVAARQESWLRGNGDQAAVPDAQLAGIE